MDVELVVDGFAFAVVDAVDGGVGGEGEAGGVGVGGEEADAILIEVLAEPVEGGEVGLGAAEEDEAGFVVADGVEAGLGGVGADLTEVLGDGLTDPEGLEGGSEGAEEEVEADDKGGELEEEAAECWGGAGSPLEVGGEGEGEGGEQGEGLVGAEEDAEEGDEGEEGGDGVPEGAIEAVEQVEDFGEVGGGAFFPEVADGEEGEGGVDAEGVVGEFGGDEFDEEEVGERPGEE